MQQSSSVDRLSVKGSATKSTVASTMDSTVASTLASTVASTIASSSTMDSTVASAVASDSTVDSTVASKVATASTVDSTVASTVASKVATDSSRIIDAQNVHYIERIGTAHIHFPDSAPKETTRLNDCVQKLELENTGLKQLANELKRRLLLQQQRERQWAATVQRLNAENNQLKLRTNESQRREQQWAASVRSVTAQKDATQKLMTQLAKGLFHATYIATGKQIAPTLQLLDTVVCKTRTPFPRQTIACFNQSRTRASFTKLKGTSTMNDAIHSGKVAIGLLLQSKERLEEFRNTVAEMCKHTTAASVSVPTSIQGFGEVVKSRSSHSPAPSGEVSNSSGIRGGVLRSVKDTTIDATLSQLSSAMSTSSAVPPHKRRRVPQSKLTRVTSVPMPQFPMSDTHAIASIPTKTTAEKRSFRQQSATDIQ